MTLQQRGLFDAAQRWRQRGFIINPFAFAGTATDPDFASVSLLINPAAADTSTTFTDLSSNANTLTAVGNAQHDTAIAYLTSSSIETDGTGDAVTAPSGSIFDLGSGHYTLEAWVYITSFAASRGLFSKRASSAVYAPFSLYVDGPTNRINYLSSANGSSWGINITASGTLAASTWTHVAVDFDGTTVRLYQGGSVVASTATAHTVMSNSNAVSVAAGAENGDLSFQGRLGPARITKGVARYAGAFTPPAAAFPTS